MRMICPSCGQRVDAAENRADGAVRCPECRVLIQLPGRSRHSMSVSGMTGSPRVGLGWPGYVVVGLVVALTAAAFVFFRGHVQQWVLSRVLPEPPKDAIKLVDFRFTPTLSGPTNSPPKTLDERKQRAGLTYLVVDVSVDSAAAKVRRLTDEELQEVKRANPGFSMSEVWVSLPKRSWFKIVGPRHPLQSVRAHQEAAGVFASTPSWNSPPTSSKPDRVQFTVCFEVDQRLAEAGDLSFQFRWKRPFPLKKPAAPSK